MLARLKRETHAHQLAAEDGRLEPLSSTATLGGYRSYLSLVYGFEAPIENAFLTTSDLGCVMDLRWRTRVRLLKSDLAALGILDATRLPATAVPLFGSASEALGWMYVLEQTAGLHAQLHRHFARCLPHQVAGAGCYLLAGARSVELRLGELGAALDTHAVRPIVATKIVEAARTAFRRQRLWFEKGLPLEVSRDVGR